MRETICIPVNTKGDVFLAEVTSCRGMHWAAHLEKVDAFKLYIER